MRKILYFLIAILIISCSDDSDSPQEEVEISLPSLSTTVATSITENSATLGGNITDDGGAEVTERGVVWNTESNPTTVNNKSTGGTGTGEFSVTLANLERSTQYFARAYAINSEGTAYGNEVAFNTSAVLATITTKEVTAITENTAVSGGEITDDGGSEIISKGVCWSTSPNPTIEDSTTEDGDGVSGFDSELLELEPNTQYYVRAYAQNDAGVAYGNELEFTTAEIPTKVFEGDVILKTQQEVDEFGQEEYEMITGSLTIGDRTTIVPSDITNLSALNTVKEIEESLFIWNNDNLDNFSGFEHLESVGVDLEINGNDKILDVSGFEGIQVLGGELIVQGNDALRDINLFEEILPNAKRIFILMNDSLVGLSGFTNVTELAGELRITANSSLTNLNGLEQLNSVFESILISSNNSINDISGLYNLEVVQGDLRITDTAIPEIHGFDLLTSVAGELRISQNPQLNKLSGFSLLNDLGSLAIGGNQNLQEIAGFGNVEMIKGDFSLSNIGLFQEISGFANLSRVEGSVFCFSNNLFSYRFLSKLSTVDGDFIINGDQTIGRLLGLESLATVGGNLHIDNSRIQDLDNFDSLVNIGGDFRIRFNDFLREVEFSALEAIGGDLLIEANLDLLFNLDEPWALRTIGGNLAIKTNNASASTVEGLRNLNAFQNLTNVAGNIEFTNNRNLEDYCAIQTLLSTFNGSFSASENAYNPSLQDILDGNCSN